MKLKSSKKRRQWVDNEACELATTYVKDTSESCDQLKFESAQSIRHSYRQYIHSTHDTRHKTQDTIHMRSMRVIGAAQRSEAKRSDARAAVYSETKPTKKRIKADKWKVVSPSRYNISLFLGTQTYTRHFYRRIATASPHVSYTNGYIGTYVIW